MAQDVLDTNIAVVRRLCEQWPWLTLDDFREMLAADCDYRNIPVSGSLIGPDAAHKMIARMKDSWDIRLVVNNITASGDVVLTERTEYFKHSKGEKADCELPVMGAFELKDGKIVGWRDYFDMGQAKPLMG